MPDRYNRPPEGAENWNTPLNENFTNLDVDVEHRGSGDPSTAGITPTTGSKYLDVDTGDIYLADGSSWGSPVWNLADVAHEAFEDGTSQGTFSELDAGTDLSASVSNDRLTLDSTASGGSGDPTSTEGIADVRTHVGPFPPAGTDTYHSPPSGDEYGIAFAAQDDLTIHSVVVDVDTSSASTDTVTIELYPVDSRTVDGIQTGTMTDSMDSSTLSDGPNRVDLGFTIPSGDGYSEYALFFNEASRTDGSGNKLQFRRIDTWAGWDDYSDLSGDGIDLLQGGIKDQTSSDFSAYYYYFFDLEVGDATTQVTSPWSHDVEELYMRPRDPAEEYDVGPRALWVDTS